MSVIGQYLKDTQGELRHVAWPTRLQTIVYTALVVLISLGIAAYLGLFDYLFTSGLGRAVSNLPTAPVPAQQQPANSSTSPVTVTPGTVNTTNTNTNTNANTNAPSAPAGSSFQVQPVTAPANNPVK